MHGRGPGDTLVTVGKTVIHGQVVEQMSPILQKRGYSVQSAGCAMTPVQRNRTNAGLI